MASFQRHLPTPFPARTRAAPEWQIAMPEVQKPWELPSEQDKINHEEAAQASLSSAIAQKKTANPRDPSIAADEATLSSISAVLHRRKLRLEHNPFESRPLEPQGFSHAPNEAYSARKVRYWVRARERLSPSSSSGIPHAQHAALGYLTDNLFIHTVGRINPTAASETDSSLMVSLDHTVYFHLGSEMRIDTAAPGSNDLHGWLLIEMDAPWVANERGVVTQRIWRALDGRLIATCIQEGLVRLKGGGSIGEKKRGDGRSAGGSSRSSKL